MGPPSEGSLPSNGPSQAKRKAQSKVQLPGPRTPPPPARSSGSSPRSISGCWVGGGVGWGVGVWWGGVVGWSWVGRGGMGWWAWTFGHFKPGNLFHVHGRVKTPRSLNGALLGNDFLTKGEVTAIPRTSQRTPPACRTAHGFVRPSTARLQGRAHAWPCRFAALTPGASCPYKKTCSVKSLTQFKLGEIEICTPDTHTHTNPHTHTLTHTKGCVMSCEYPKSYHQKKPPWPNLVKMPPLIVAVVYPFMSLPNSLRKEIPWGSMPGKLWICCGSRSQAVQ